MTFVWIILAVIVYIAIGGVMGAFINDEELDWACIIWPLSIFVLLLAGAFEGAKWLVNKFIIRRDKK